MFWIIWFYCRRQRQRRMLEAGMIRPAQPVIGTVPTNYNNQYWSPAVPTVTAVGPPSYDTVTAAQEAGKQELPPSYQEAVRHK
ncbi:hypothetical protein ACOMHN_033807 [Nucella lapillus]